MTLQGEIILQSWVDLLGGDRINIVRADPRVLIAGSLLAKMRVETHPDVIIDGDVITIDAVNRRYVYRIIPDSYDPLDDTYAMEWPD